MLILALDTTTRAGSLSLDDDETVLETLVGDASRTHATRLPGDILDCLARHGRTLADIDVYAVAAGPGSFTGLRIGIATVQGLAFAHGRPVVGVSALDALAETAAGTEVGATRNRAGSTRIAAWMDAQRGEVYACLYRAIDLHVAAVGPAIVERPEAVLEAWRVGLEGPVRFTGDGAIAYADVLSSALGERVAIVRPMPALAPALARIARREAGAGRAVHPHAIRPIYIRRPDAELARDRRAGVDR